MAKQKTFTPAQIVLVVVCFFFLILTLFPIYVMVVKSFKSPMQEVMNPFGISFPFRWANYAEAWGYIDYTLLNTFVITIAITALVLVLSSMASFGFTRFQMPGKNVLFLMFLASTLYHSMDPSSRHKEVFHILDHIFIYVAIAGSYTPIALSVIGGWQGVVITVVQWAMVLFGIFYKSLSRRSIPAVSLTIYLVMGWTIVFFLPLFIRRASEPLLWLIAAGGVLYTVGAWFYARKGFRYHHLVWHLLINLAVVCHFAGIVFFLY